MLVRLRIQREVTWGNALLAAMLGLFMPILAQANSVPLTNCSPTNQICIQNQGGSATTNLDTSFSLSGSTVSVIGNVVQPPGSTLNFTTGTFASGSLGAGGTFNAGGSFVVTGNFAGFSGVIFNGTFSGPVTWSVVGVCTKAVACTYDLSGPVSGTWYNGEQVFGATTQLFFKTTKGPYTGGPITPEAGSTFIVTPEPGSLAFMGTGLLGIGLIVRRKIPKRGS
jgi:hypothetical protein